MAQKNSSFHMGDEFNGSGKKTYLMATQHNKYKPLSQENVRLTPDYKQWISKVVGAQPLVMDPAKTGVTSMLKALGAMPSILRVIVTKDKRTGKYQTSFSVRKIQLTTGAYLHKSQRLSENTISIEQFIRNLVNRTIRDMDFGKITEKFEKVPVEDSAEAPAEASVEAPAVDPSVLDRYVNERVFEAMGWDVKKFKNTYGDDAIEKLKEYLFQYGITDPYSVCMFLATIGIESGDGRAKLEEKNPPAKATYTKNTKGAGLIQVTGFDQKAFLKYIEAEMKKEGSTREDKYLLTRIQELIARYPKNPSIITINGEDKEVCEHPDDIAGFIATYFPIESAAWYWGVYKKCKYWEDVNTIYEDEDGDPTSMSLNQYICKITENADANDVKSMILKEDPPWDNLFLATQYYVNGSPWQLCRLQKIAECMDDTYEQTNGELNFTLPQGDPKQGPHSDSLPNGWTRRLEDWKQMTYELFG